MAPILRAHTLAFQPWQHDMIFVVTWKMDGSFCGCLKMPNEDVTGVLMYGKLFSDAETVFTTLKNRPHYDGI